MLVFRTSKSVTENTTRVHWNVACVAGLKRGRGGRVREQGSKEGGDWGRGRAVMETNIVLLKGGNNCIASQN